MYGLQVLQDLRPVPFPTLISEHPFLPTLTPPESTGSNISAGSEVNTWPILAPLPGKPVFYLINTIYMENLYSFFKLQLKY